MAGLESWTIGKVAITRIVETVWDMPIEGMEEAIGSAGVEECKTGLQWMRPFYLNDQNEVSGSFHSYLVQTPTKRIVVDTGVGNGRKRAFEGFANYDTDYLERFSKVWDPAIVDEVVSTHLHTDHCGWNTKLEDGKWVPTFPNAKYRYVEGEYESWKSLAADPGAADLWDPQTWEMIDPTLLLADSIEPPKEAGLVEFIEPDGVLTPEVRLIPTHGHTAGHVSVLVESGGQSAVMSGDLVHDAWQVAHPEWHNPYDLDRPRASITRTQFLERFADSPTMVLFSHIGPSPAAFIKRDGDGYLIVPASEVAAS